MKVTLISKQDTEERQGTTPIRGAYGKIVDIPYAPTLIIASPAHVPYLRQMGTITKDGLKRHLLLLYSCNRCLFIFHRR